MVTFGLAVSRYAGAVGTASCVASTCDDVAVGGVGVSVFGPGAMGCPGAFVVGTVVDEARGVLVLDDD